MSQLDHVRKLLNNKEEKWKIIPGIPKYEMSSKGKVRRHHESITYLKVYLNRFVFSVKGQHVSRSASKLFSELFPGEDNPFEV